MQDFVDRFRTAHLWVGNILVDETEYLKYFEQYDLEDDEYCEFARDIGLDEEEYDEDYIILFPLLENPISVEELLSVAVPFEDQHEMEKAIKMCHEKGIDKINTFVFYSDPTLHFDNNKIFNGLIYIGEFLAEHE